MKIFSPYSSEINAVIAENTANLEFVGKAQAEIILPELPRPFKIGEILDVIEASVKNLKISGLNLDISKNTLSKDDISISITEKEAAILKYLAENREASRDELIKNVWNYADSADSKTVENHIYRLRNKITEAFSEEVIITEGSSYKLA